MDKYAEYLDDADDASGESTKMMREAMEHTQVDSGIPSVGQEHTEQNQLNFGCHSTNHQGLPDNLGGGALGLYFGLVTQLVTNTADEFPT